ncbi:hypothetical protein P691DRAFT_802577 [Macrolepiota fuliginosa MF-IS2]|uniref:tRNA ligase n=1 Tax=Macrolepiota fuliginosa MF-IS2 TaxID=1400762 RepID=A0A9P5XDL4_9AGAR|nr:hypothetical protein P691DRAFT_802577 [Macrolepiota fuliginosa MF-IS2]
MPPAPSLEDSQLITDLIALEKKSPKLVRSSIYPAPADPNILVRSWKLNEFKYYDIPSPFPTFARGLFTTELLTESGHGVKHRIVTRGYDKFFNIGEVPWTTWQALEAHTAPPYTLSLKSNGCIIFIAALTPKKLVVTSKHSLGPVQGVSTSHAEAGEQWIMRYLEEKGKTEVDLASRLWEENWTAVAELCDDSFEEHVLAYPPDRTGLHLHGLNVATKAFKTMPHETVDAFAEEWGFIKTRTHTVHHIDEVREFTSHVAEVGEWEGEAVEGFVVRTHVTEPPTEGRGGAKSGKSVEKGQSPYAPGSSFFFKVKFDEPYMMYRDWREVTKTLLTTKGPVIPSILPKGKMKRKETKIYVDWVIGEIKRDRKQFDGYTKGHGIIATRERFLKWFREQKEKGELKEELEEETPTAGKKGGKVIIVPIAIPGCGKTSVGIALTHLFGFGHTQSDNIKAKKAAPAFLKNVGNLLVKHDIVIADKNNHLKEHRQQLRDTASGLNARLIALNWSLDDKPPATVHRICSDRITSRGENHQTLTADTSLRRSHEDVVWMFIKGHEELSEQEVDGCVDIEIEDDLEGMVKSAVDGLWKIFGGPGGMLGEEKPGEEKIREALEQVGDYKAVKGKDTRSILEGKEAKEQKKRKEKPPRYYGILPEVDVDSVLDGVFSSGSDDVDEKVKDGAAFWGELKKEKRATTRPHITIVHGKSLPQESDVWEAAAAVSAADAPPGFKCTLGHILWDGRVMVLTVDNLELELGEGDEAVGKKFLKVFPADTRERLHVTVGTENSGIPPVEGKALVERWRRGERENEGVFEIELGKGVIVGGRLKGLWS